MVDKAEMTYAYMNRDNPVYFRKFIRFIDEIGMSCVNKLKINDNYKEDVKQIAVEHAYRKMDHFNPEHGSAAYSFFYKVILRRCLYELRDINKKKNRMPDICSYNKLNNSCGSLDDLDMFVTDEDPSLAYEPNSSEDEIIIINNKPYNRAIAIQKIREAKTIVRREKLALQNNVLFSLKTQAPFDIKDDFVSMVCVQIVENKEMKAKSLRRSKNGN